MDKFTELSQAYEKIKSSLIEEGTIKIKTSIAEFLKKYPMIESVSWPQYTPGFNDGDPCYFTVGTPTFYDFNGNDAEPGAYDTRSSYLKTELKYAIQIEEAETTKEKEQLAAKWFAIYSRDFHQNMEDPTAFLYDKNAILKSIEAYNALDADFETDASELSSLIEDMYEFVLIEAFGEYCRVTCTREGCETSDYYD